MTNSVRSSFSTSPRTRRAISVHCVSAKAAMIESMPGSSTMTRSETQIRKGMAIMMSTRRMIAMSTRPP